MSTSIGSKVRLYELALEDGRSASPFVWRIRYALAHKGISFETAAEHALVRLMDAWNQATVRVKLEPRRRRQAAIPSSSKLPITTGKLPNRA